MCGIPGLDVKAHSTTHPSVWEAGTYKANSGPGLANEVRYDINRDATLAGVAAHFFNQGNIFRYPSEICSVFLVPKKIDGATYNNSATAIPTTYDNMMSWWQGSSLSTMSLTGDNLREEPYDHIYPRLTTKSNSYTVHYRVQRLQKNQKDRQAGDEWVEGRDAILADQRGSTLLERYVDPNDAGLTAAWDTNTMSLNFAASNLTKNTPDLSQYYKFRVISTKQSLPP